MKSRRISALGYRIWVIVALISVLAMNFGVANAAPLYDILPNDNFSTPTLIETVPFSDTLNDVVNSATPQGGDPANDDPLISCIGLAGLATVWYQYNATDDGLLSVSTIGSGYDTVVAVWTVSGGTFEQQACNDDYYPATDQSFVYASVVSGTTYYVEVAQVGGAITEGMQSSTPEGIESAVTLNQLVLNIGFTPMSIVSQGFYDDRDANWRFPTSPWLQFNGAGPYAGTYTYSNTTNADATFAFKGTKLDLYYTGNTDRGVMEIYIDDLFVASLNQYSASLQWQKKWTSPLLSSGTHILRLVHKSGTYVDFDAVEVYNAVGEGIYEDTSVAWFYSGAWTTFSGSGPSDDTLRYTSTVGDYAQLVFSGTRFRLTFTKYPNRGSIDVYVDGSKITTINAYAPTPQWQQTYTSPMYVDGTHTVRFVHAGGGNYIDIDAIEIFGAPIPVEPGTYDDANTAWIYSGTWNTYASSGPYLNTLHYTNEQNASATIVFSGVQFTVWFTKHPNRGNLEVWIDGELAYTLNQNGSALAWQQSWTVPTPLSDGTHTVTFRNPNASTATFVDIDSITIVGPVGPGTYDDANRAWSYSGAWTAYTSTGPYANTLHYSNAQGASATIVFTGTQFTVRFTRHPNRGNIEVWIDGALAHTFSQNGGALTWQQTWTLPAPLANGTHTVQFKNPNASTATYVDIDAITIVGPVGAGTYDDMNPAWTYTGTWTTYAAGGPYASSLHFTNAQNSTATIQFTGTQFTLWYTKHPNRGNLEIWIDGVLAHTFNQNGSALAWQQSWTLPTPLTYGTHTLQFKNPNASTGTYVDIDAITIIDPVAPGTYDDSHAAWIYGGVWGTYSGSGPYASTMHYSNSQGSSATIVFTGTQFTVRFAKHPNRGNVEVWIDGALAYTFSQNGSSLAWQQSWTLPVVLAEGTHTVQFKNPNASTSTYIDIDSITIADPVGQGTYDDAHEAWIYAGTWTNYTGGGPYASTMHYTNVQGSSATIVFTGTQFAVWFTRHPNRGNVEVWIDGALAYTFSQNGGALSWQENWTLPVPLADGAHVVQFKNPNASGATYIDIDAIQIQ